ncbi:MAG TPA: hypothetical protein VGQ11_11305 [Candidatus Acidoferrales bacterium]|nr:hypothetical protein [Candidatus Acidoferrales bacterium]
MICERFKTRLKDFALGADDAEFRAHVDDCAACRAALDAERALLASIDRGLAQMVEGEPSGDFAAHVRRRIEQQAATPRPWFAGWVPVTAAALALTALVAFWMIRRTGGVPDQAKEKAPPVNISKPPREPQMAGKTPPVSPPSNTGSVQKHRPPREPQMAATPSRPPALTNRPPREPQMAANREPEVLVSRGQLAAVMQMYNSVWNGKADGSSLIAQAAPVEDALKPLVRDELKISPLVIERLSEEGQSNSSPEKR